MGVKWLPTASGAICVLIHSLEEKEEEKEEEEEEEEKERIPSSPHPNLKHGIKVLSSSSILSIVVAASICSNYALKYGYSELLCTINVKNTALEHSV